MVQSFRGFCLSLLIGVIGSLPAQAAIEIEITKALESAQPIAIVPFRVNVKKPLPENISEIIRADFARSGEFRPIPATAFKQQPAQPQEVDANYWLQLGVDHLVVGEVTEKTPGTYQVAIALLDPFVISQAQEAGAQTVVKPLIYRNFDVTTDKLREFSHYLSDLIYEKLTGVQGIFSTRIAYVTVEWLQNNRRHYRLEVSDADGYNPVTMLTSKEPIMSPSWSPDGHKIAYVSFERFRSEIYVADLRTGRRELISAVPGINGAPAWSPDGSKIALVLSRENVPKIHVLDLASHRMQQVTEGFAIDTEPRWYPDGKSLLFTSNRGGQPQLYRLSLADGKTQRLTFTGNYNARGSITPDGKHLIMIHRGTTDSFNIAVQDLETGKLRPLTQTRLDESPTLAPNGRAILYGTMEAGQHVLNGVSIDGRVKWRVPSRLGELQEPAWSPFLQ